MKLHGKMVAVLDLIAGGNSIAEAARRLDIVSRTIFYWIQRSRNGHEKMVIEWGEWGSAPFHKHLDSAQAMAIALMRSEAESNSTIGFEEVVIFQGQVQYKLDPRKVGLDDDMCILLFGDTDRFLRNEKGEAIPLTVKRKPSDALVLRMLSANFSKFQERTRSDVNVNGVLGVMALPRPGDKIEQPKRITEKSDEFTLEEVPSPEALPPRIAIGRTAKNNAELEHWESSGEFKPHKVEFVSRDGASKMIGQEAKKPGAAPALTAQGQGNPAIDRNDANLLRRALLDELPRDAEATAAAKDLPAQMPPSVPVFPQKDTIDDVTGEVVEPLRPSNQAIADKIAELKGRRDRGERLSAVETQILDGNSDSLRAPHVVDHAHEGSVPDGGFKVV